MAPPRTVADHADLVARLLAPLLATPRTETIALRNAASRVCAADVRSAVDLPLFRNSQMDGYAVHAADVAHPPVSLPVVGDLPAGHAEPAALAPGHTVRIMTGAPVPAGADAIVPVEDTSRPDRGDAAAAGSVVEIRRSRQPGDYVREPASDLRRGDVIVPAGTLLAPRHLAALAAAGVPAVKVCARPRVAVLTTGAELVAPDATARFGQVFDANGVALAALVEEAGASVSLSASSDDDPEEFARLLDAAVECSDLVLTSGGISQGAYEVVRDVLEPLGADVTTIAMQPGGPQATAVVRGVPVLCFPGNPVSTQVSFIVFVRGLLRAATGLPTVPTRTAMLGEPVRSVTGKRQFLRARLTGDTVVPVSGPSSHLVASMARADVLLDVPAEIERLDAGSPVTVWLL